MAIWHAITTCNQAIWDSCGRRMAETFAEFWPQEISLTIYAEGFRPRQNGQVRRVDLDQAAPWLVPWKAARTKEQHGYRPRPGKPHNFKYDAVRFSHKVAAIGAAAETTDADVLIWLDADIVTHSLVTLDWLADLIPEDADMAWLDRERCYPECGVLFFRLPACGQVIRRIVTAYQTGAIFKLQQWHDSYVIETICTAAGATDGLRIASLSGEGRKSHHPLVNSPGLGACLDHLKGSRKAEGRSRPADLLCPRPEPYWQ